MAVQLLQDIDGVRNCFRAEEASYVFATFFSSPKVDSRAYAFGRCALSKKSMKLKAPARRCSSLPTISNLQQSWGCLFFPLSDRSRQKGNDQKRYQAAQHEDRAEAARGGSSSANGRNSHDSHERGRQLFCSCRRPYPLLTLYIGFRFKSPRLRLKASWTSFWPKRLSSRQSCSNLRAAAATSASAARASLARLRRSCRKKSGL